MSIKVEVFTSPSCPHCPMAIEVANQAKEDLKDEIELITINVLEDQTKAREYGIMAVPAIAVDGIVKFVGAPTKEQLIDAVKLAAIPQ